MPDQVFEKVLQGFHKSDLPGPCKQAWKDFIFMSEMIFNGNSWLSIEQGNWREHFIECFSCGSKFKKFMNKMQNG